MNNIQWSPQINIELAHKWLNIDTYWASSVIDPADSEPQVAIAPLSSLPRPVLDYPGPLKQKYPLVNQAGYPRRSRLHDPGEPDIGQSTLLEQLASQLRTELDQNNLAEARRKISQIETVCAAIPKSNPDADPLQIVEARLELGLAYYAMGENGQALKQLEICIKGFGADTHAEAIARWIAGHIQLETPQLYFDNGLVDWQRSWQIFAQATTTGESNLHPKSQAQWYKERAKLMLDDLQAALAYGGIQARPAANTSAAPPPQPSPPPSYPAPDPTPKTNAGGPRPAPKPSQRPSPNAPFFLLPILPSTIQAGDPCVAFDEEPEDYATTEEIWIDGKPHTFHRFNGTASPLELRPEYRYEVMQVKGDSMNQFVAPSEYVVLARPKDDAFQPADGEIVAVVIPELADDELATLKEWRVTPDGVELRPRSYSPEHQPKKYQTPLRAVALAIGKLTPAPHRT